MDSNAARKLFSIEQVDDAVQALADRANGQRSEPGGGELGSAFALNQAAKK